MTIEELMDKLREVERLDFERGGVYSLCGNAADEIERLRHEHDARVSELLAANNREVERRRKAEACYNSTSMIDWMFSNKAALKALVEGAAGVVKLDEDGAIEVFLECDRGGRFVRHSCYRLDVKPGD